jgi:hypothetical protein
MRFAAAMRPLALGVPLLFLGSCGLLPTVCTMEFGVEIRPAARSLAVGEEFTAQATGVSCGGRDRSPYAVTWISSDTTVASVHPESGRVRGVAPGTAEIRAHDHPDHAWWWGAVAVTVVGP